jgi:hypothetical protein
MQIRSLIFYLVCSFCLFLISCTGKNSPLDTADNFPQDTAQVFITYDDIFKDTGHPEYYSVQDFDLNDSVLFVHPIAAYGLYEYNLVSKELRELVNYSAGDWIAHDSIYVFYELSSYGIYRYNLVTDTTDLRFDLTGLDYTNIGGLDVYKHVLYAYLHSHHSGNQILAKFSLDGNLLDTIPYPRGTSYLTIHNDIVYALPWDTTYALSCFSLNTESFLPDQPFPVESGDGIRIFAEKLYYTGTPYKERYIGIMPIPE